MVGQYNDITQDNTYCIVGNTYIFDEWMCCRKEDPCLGSKSGLLSNTHEWIVQGDTRADKARDFIGKGHLGGEHQGKETQEDCSATWLKISGLLGLVLRD